MSPGLRVSTRVWLGLAVAVWLLGATTGLRYLLDYQTHAGAPANPPDQWPRIAGPQPGLTMPTLLLIAHPRCPCTRATLAEFAKVIARTHGRVAYRILFVVPKQGDPEWSQTELVHIAAALPDVRVLFDAGGRMARVFGTQTSGQVLLYDTTGHLVFAGGITPGRGHEGDNAGRDAILAMVDSRLASTSATPVYGCELFTPAANAKASCPH